jgi:hypothetical protein
MLERAAYWRVPERDHHVDWHALARFGRARSGQCRALAIECKVLA